MRARLRRSVEAPAGVLEIHVGLVVQDLGDAPVVGGVGKGEQGDFDNLVVLDAQSGGLAVDVERAAQRRGAGVAQPRGKLEPVQRARVRGRFLVHGWFLRERGVGWVRCERPGTVAELVTSPPARRHWIGVFVCIPLTHISLLFIRLLTPKEAGWRGCRRRRTAFVRVARAGRCRARLDAGWRCVWRGARAPAETEVTGSKTASGRSAGWGVVDSHVIPYWISRFISGRPEVDCSHCSAFVGEPIRRRSSSTHTSAPR